MNIVECYHGPSHKLPQSSVNQGALSSFKVRLVRGSLLTLG
jgi:hypothetical protein